ncbi:MAG TPA: hypothetical protein VKA46_43445 [Gemmataceae bacterium]|nr:hypothetical protein [Gemmataceae bacterium]
MTPEDLFLFLAGVMAAVVGQVVWGLLRWRRSSRLPGALRAFFGKDPYQLPIVGRTFITVDLPNLHLAIAQFLEATGAFDRLIGYTSPGFENSLRQLIAQRTFFESVSIGPVQYREVDVDVDSRLQCVEHGIHLIAARGVVTGTSTDPLSRWAQ